MKIPTPKSQKIMGLVLSGALLATQSLFAYQPEKNFWSERRRAVQRSPSMVLASLPQTVRGPDALAAQFPSPEILRSSLTPSVVLSVPKTFLNGHADLLAALSPAHGSVRKVSLGKNAGSREPVVIHIQDVHMNAEAQRNIQETVTGLLKSGQLGLVALEGSTEDIALQPFVDFPNRKAVELTADYLLRENKISGPIHAAMTAQGKLPRILGIDDPAHYQANVLAYKESAPKLEEARLKVKKQQGELDKQKKVVFSPALLALDHTVIGYRNDKVSLGEYVEVLAKNSKGFKVMGTFLKALKTERTLDFKQVEAERSRLIEKLTQTLTPQEISALMAQSLAYRTGELRYGDFYAQLKETCRQNGIHLSEYPAMDEYIRYVLLADSIDAEQLLNEIAAMEKAAYDTLAKTPEEKLLATQSRHVWLTSKLVDFSLTPPEWGEYKGLPATKGPDLISFESFYREAESRDTAMAKNLLSALDLQSKSGSTTPPIALLVTGGFHAEGMAKQLTEKGATVISYVPKIEKVDTAQGSAYLSVFTQEKTPLEKLFQGEKLFLSPDMARAAKEIGAPVVPGINYALNNQEIDVPIEKRGALRKFLDETMGPGVDVQVRKTGEDPEKGTVKISVKIGTKEMILEIKTGDHFEIVSVNDFIPKSPSWFIGDYGEVVARLHTWLGPVAKWVVTFTEAPILWALPGWTAAHYAWWLVNHPKITSVSHVVWQLAFLEGTSSQMKRVSPVSRIPFFATIQSLLAQLRTHPGFNLVSPIQATIKGSSANHLRDSLIADLREAYGQIKSGERRRFSDISGLLLGEGRISELFPTPNGKTGKRVSFGGGYDVKSVVLEVGRDTMGLYWAFESKKKDGGLVRSTLRWDEETQAMVRRGVQLELELRSAYEELKLGERRRIGDIEELVYLKSGQFCVNFPTPNGKTGKAVNFGGGRDLESVELEVGRDKMGLYWAFQSSKKGGGLVKSTLRWDERTRAMVSEGEQDAEQLVRELRSAYEGLKLAEQRRISDIEEFVILKEGRLRAIFPTPNGKTGKGVSFGGGYDVESVELEVGRDTMGLYWAFQSTKKDGGLVRSTLRWDEETQAMVTRGEQLERELRSAYEELKLGERRRIGNIEELVYLKLGQLCVHFPTPNGKTGKVVSFGGGYNVESVELEVGRDTMGLYWTFQSTKKGGGLVKSTQRWDEGTQAMVSEAEKEAEQLERELRSAYEELKLGERRRIGNIEELVFLKLGRLYVVFPTPNGKTGKVVFMGGGRNLKSVHLQVGREENGVIFWEFQSQKEDGSFVRSMMKWVNGKMQLVSRGGEKEALDDVSRVVDSVLGKLDGINSDMSSYLAVRHGRDFRTILWGAIPNEIKSMLNREKLEALLTRKIIETIKEKVTGQAESALRNLPTEPDISPRLLEDVDLTQSDIQQLAHEMENVVTNAEAALKDSLKTQSVDFVKRLEEDHFFSQFYRPIPGKTLLSDIVQNVDELLADPSLIPISRLALDLLRSEVEGAKGLQDQLHKNGLKKERFLNLYQILGVQKILTMKKVLLGDEMGLGKTLQTLCAFLMSGENEMVVVAPRKALGRWLEDIHKHLSAPLDVVILGNVDPPPQLLTMQNVTVSRIVDPEERMAYLTNARGPPAVGRKRIVVTNFELLPRLGLYLRKNEIAEIPGFSTGFVAIDEVHLVKNTNQTSTLLLGRPGVNANSLLGDYRVAMSGTPLENAPIDLLAILRWLSLGGESEAEEFFAGLSPAQFKKVFQKADLEKLSRLSTYLAQHMIRRFKGHVMRDLPEKKFISVSLSPFSREMRLNGKSPIPLPGNYNRQIFLYDKALSNFPAFERIYRGISLEEKSDDVFVPGSAQLLRLEQVTMTPDIFREQDDPDPIDSIKMDAMVSLAKQHLNRGEYVSVMSDHLLAIRAVQAALLRSGVSADDIAMFHGEMNQVEQERNRERFQRGEARIILCTRQSAGTSIELTRTDAMIFMNTPWTPASLDQAVDRVHRQDSDGRHKEGKDITIYNLNVDFSISIDSLKINLIRLKRAFGEMIVNGNLTPEILETFENTDGGPLATIRESMLSREAPLSYERKLFNEFHFLLGRAIQSRDPEMKRQLWNKISDIYHLILFHKATYFANQANLDHLSGDGFPELKGRLVKVLDLGSGPSVLYHAYDQSREKLKGRSLQLQISEFDASAAMLARGVVRPGEQTVGSFSRLGEAYPAKTFDVVNMSYSFDLADHPAGLIKTIHSLLKEKGLFALILPKDTIIPEDFYKGMEAAGFKLRTAQGGQLESKIPETHYHELVREYGEEFAKDIARTAHTRHTYLLAVAAGLKLP